MTTYTFDLECPRCGNEVMQEVGRRAEAARLCCGDCLMKTVEIVEMKIVRVMVNVNGEDR